VYSALAPPRWSRHANQRRGNRVPAEDGQRRCVRGRAPSRPVGTPTPHSSTDPRTLKCALYTIQLLEHARICGVGNGRHPHGVMGCGHDQGTAPSRVERLSSWSLDVAAHTHDGRPAAQYGGLFDAAVSGQFRQLHLMRYGCACRRDQRRQTAPRLRGCWPNGYGSTWSAWTRPPPTLAFAAGRQHATQPCPARPGRVSRAPARASWIGRRFRPRCRPCETCGSAATQRSLAGTAS